VTINDIGLHKLGKLCLYFVAQIFSGARIHISVILNADACRTLPCSHDQHGLRHKHPGLTSDKPYKHSTFTEYKYLSNKSVICFKNICIFQEYFLDTNRNAVWYVRPVARKVTLRFHTNELF
jgi:hypothetical protein